MQLNYFIILYHSRVLAGISVVFLMVTFMRDSAESWLVYGHCTCNLFLNTKIDTHNGMGISVPHLSGSEHLLLHSMAAVCLIVFAILSLVMHFYVIYFPCYTS